MTKVIRTAPIAATAHHLVTLRHRQPWIALEGLPDERYERIQHRAPAARRGRPRHAVSIQGPLDGAVMDPEVRGDGVLTPALDGEQAADLGDHLRRNHRQPPAPVASSVEAGGSEGSRRGRKARTGGRKRRKPPRMDSDRRTWTVSSCMDARSQSPLACGNYDASLSPPRHAAEPGTPLDASRGDVGLAGSSGSGGYPGAEVLRP